MSLWLGGERSELKVSFPDLGDLEISMRSHPVSVGTMLKWPEKSWKIKKLIFKSVHPQNGDFAVYGLEI